MAIRDRLSRKLRQSFSSSSASATTTTTTITSNTSSSSSAGEPTTIPSTPLLAKTASRLARYTSWRSGTGTGAGTRSSSISKASTEPDDDEEEADDGLTTPFETLIAIRPKVKYSRTKSSYKKKSSSSVQHPSERPLTETNLRYLEMLSKYTLDFDVATSRMRRLSLCEGISPGCSRRPSVAGEEEDGYFGMRRRSSAIAPDEI